MIFNLLHRPCGHFKAYDFQRKCAHELGLKATVLIPTGQLNNEKVIADAKEDNSGFNDELGLWIEPTADMPNTQVWLLSEEDKRKTVKYSIDRFFDIFGRYPESVGNYVMDSSLIRYIKEYCPSVVATVAGCFEEGVKVFHGCNNSWYLFSEGMCWNPWYPSKTQSVRPAKNEDDWAGVVAVPHLSRDLVLGYEGRNDFFASHPANAQRGLANDGYIHNYDFNLVDQYRLQEDFNDGFSYYQTHVGPGWFFGNPNILDDSDVTLTLYRETLEYIVKLRDEGQVTDMHLGEFAKYYIDNIPVGGTSVGVGKDILFGSGKQYVWVYNKSMRVLVDTFQGGSIGDLRPYIGEYEAFTGVDSKTPLMNSYPYIIQSQYRTGVKHHHEDGARTTLLVSHKGETLDMCFYPSRISELKREGYDIKLSLEPVKMKFKDGFELNIQTVYDFKASGDIGITRKIVSSSGDLTGTELTEYLKGCYGFTEYPENLKGIEFFADGEKIGGYKYSGKVYRKENAVSVGVRIPQISTEAYLCSDGSGISEISDGHLFSPFFTLKTRHTLKENETEVKSWLNIRKPKE